LFLQQVAAAADRLAEGIASLPAMQAGGDTVDDFLPGLVRNHGVDAAVGQHLDPVFEQADQDQDAGGIAALKGALRSSFSRNLLVRLPGKERIELLKIITAWL